jgi:hypothetical protein
VNPPLDSASTYADGIHCTAITDLVQYKKEVLVLHVVVKSAGPKGQK